MLWCFLCLGLPFGLVVQNLFPRPCEGGYKMGGKPWASSGAPGRLVEDHSVYIDNTLYVIPAGVISLSGI